MIRAIAAIDDKNGLAAAGHPPYDIPWHIPADLQYFKEQTSSATVLMGRKTYETLTAPLPNRRNVVASRDLTTVRDGFELVHDLGTFLVETTDTIWVIGGAKIFAAAQPYCDELYLTHVNGDYGCDRFFPDYSSDFSLLKTSRPQVDNGYEFSFAVYIKNR